MASPLAAANSAPLGLGVLGTLKAPKALHRWKSRFVRFWKTMHKLDHSVRYTSLPTALVFRKYVYPLSVRGALRAAEQAALVSGLEQPESAARKQFENLTLQHLREALARGRDAGKDTAGSGREGFGANKMNKDDSARALLTDDAAPLVFRTCQYLVEQPNASTYYRTVAEALCAVARTRKSRLEFETESEWVLRAAQNAYSLALNLLKSHGDVEGAERVFREATHKTGASSAGAAGDEVEEQEVASHEKSKNRVKLQANGAYINWTSVNHTPAISIQSTTNEHESPPLLEEKVFWDDDSRIQMPLTVMKTFRPFIAAELQHFVSLYADREHEVPDWVLNVKLKDDGEELESGSLERIAFLEQKYMRPDSMKAIPAVAEMIRQMKCHHFDLPYTNGDSEHVSIIRMSPGTRFSRWQSQGSNLSVTLGMNLLGNAFVDIGGHGRRHFAKEETISFASGWDHKLGTPMPAALAGLSGDAGVPPAREQKEQQQQQQQGKLVAAGGEEEDPPDPDSFASYILLVNTLHPGLVENQHLCASIGRRTQWEVVTSRQQHGFAKLKQEFEYRSLNPEATPLPDRFKSAGGFSRKHLPTRYNAYRPPTLAS